MRANAVGCRENGDDAGVTVVPLTCLDLPFAWLWSGPDDRVWENSDGASYPDSRLCLTDNCISNTIDYYNGQVRPLAYSVSFPGTAVWTLACWLSGFFLSSLVGWLWLPPSSPVGLPQHSWWESFVTFSLLFRWW